MNRLLLVDGHSILNRGYFGIKSDMTSPAGDKVNAVFGFLRMLKKAIDEEKITHLVVCFDLREKTFRHERFDFYKANRKKPDEDFIVQVPMIQNVLKSMNVNIATKEGYEADDLLGTLARKGEEEGYEVVIFTGDTDLLQIASDKVKIRMTKPFKDDKNYYADDVKEELGITPKEYIEFKALKGDTADNIPGAPGVGEVTAKNLITTYGSIDNIYEHIDELKGKTKSSLLDNKDLIYDCLFLVTIKTDVPVDIDLSACRIDDLYNKNAYTEFVNIGFKSLLNWFDTKNFEKDNEDNDKLLEIKSLIREEVEMPNYTGVVGIEIDGDLEELRGVYLCGGNDIVYVRNFGLLGAMLEELFRREDVTLVFFDLKRQLDNIPFKSSNIYDVKIGAYLNNPLNDSYSAEDVLSEYKKLAMIIEKGDEECIKASRAYAAYNCFEDVFDNVRAKGMMSLYQDIEAPLIYILHDMEKEGIGVSKDTLDGYCVGLSERISELEEEIYKDAGFEFKISSPKVLGEVLFEKLNLPVDKKSKTKNGYSTSADVLEKIKDEHPIVNHILEYRQLTKLYSTYASGLKDYIGEDGRIHTTFNQTVTATGRISSNDPNLQNIPVRMELGRSIRKAFVARKGYSFVDADYSQIELRVMAHLSGDESLIEAYNSAADIHSITASKVFGVSLDEVTPQMRRNAKAVNFGIIYGISAFGLGEDLGISKKLAKEYIESYFKTYPGIKEYLERTVEEAKNLGYVTTLYGRRRPIPELKSSNFMTRSFGERIAMNSPVQGTAADIMKIAMIKVYDRLKAENLQSKIILQIHDEIMIEAKDEEIDAVKKVLTEEMENAAKLQVKLIASSNVAKDWYSVK